MNGYNNTMAQAEFDFWILRYMVYAKENEPSVYKKLMKNDDFIRAYLTTRSRFEALSQKYFDSLPELEGLLNSKGYHVEIDDSEFTIVNDDMSKLSYSVRDTDRDKLIGEIQKPEYQEILSEMRDVVPDAESCVADQSSGDPGAGEEASGQSEDSGENPGDDSGGEIREDSGGGIKGILHKALKVLKTVWDMALDFLGWLWEKVSGIFVPLWEKISGLLQR